MADSGRDCIFDLLYPIWWLGVVLAISVLSRQQVSFHRPVFRAVRVVHLLALSFWTGLLLTCVGVALMAIAVEFPEQGLPFFVNILRCSCIGLWGLLLLSSLIVRSGLIVYC